MVKVILGEEPESAVVSAAPVPLASGVARQWRHAVLPLVLVSIAGAGMSLQSFVNGRLNGHVGSAELAGSISYTSGVVAMSAVLLATGLGRRAMARMRSGRRPAWWHLAACVASAVVVIVPARAAPELGVALLTAALVCGQVVGGLAFDAVGLGVGGRRPLTLPRLLGVALAVLAVTVTAMGTENDLEIGLLGLSVLAGAVIALIQAALGHLAEIMGDPLSATGMMFGIGWVAAIATWLVVVGPEAPGGWSAPVEQWVVGGILGVATAIVVARFVGHLGVLVAALALVAGQSAGGLLLDAVAPAAGAHVTVRTVVGVSLTFAAVAVSGVVWRRRAA